MDLEQARDNRPDWRASAPGPREFVAIAGAALAAALFIGWLLRTRRGTSQPNADDIYVETALQKPPALAE